MTELEAVQGIGPAVAKKLRENNVHCAEVLAFMTPHRLWYETRLGEGTSIKIIKNARVLLGLSNVKSGTEIDKEWKSRERLTTGIATFDRKLLGGIEAGSIVELYGAARGGKTQWCHQLAVTAQLPEVRGGFDTKVLWLDSEDSFRTLTIRANAIRMGLDPEKSLSRIHCAPILTRDQLIDVVQRVPTFIHEEGIRLIIIDNLGAFFRSDTDSLEYERTKSAELARVFDILHGLARTMGCIVIITNQVFNQISNYGGNPNAAVGGHIMAHSATYRFYVRRIRLDRRRISLQDHAGLPEFDLEASLDWGGFYENEKEKRAVGPVIADYLNKLEECCGQLRSWDTAEEGAA